MSIIGIGTDIVDIARIEKLYERFGNHLLERILSDQERSFLKSNIKPQKHIAWIAKRFAGKESVAKAFGTGIGKKLRFKDVSILNDNLGRPIVHIEKNILSFLERRHPEGPLKIKISLSDTSKNALSFCVLSNN